MSRTVRAGLEPLNLSEMLEQVCAKGTERIREKGLRWEQRLSPGIRVMADRVLAQSIFANLLDNALEYSPPGGRASCSLAPQAEGFLFRLTNDNPGLVPEDLDRFFEPLWRKDKARSSRLHAGIGLSLVKAFSEQMGWRVDAALSPENRVVVSLDSSPRIEMSPK